MKCYLLVVPLFISLMITDVEHLFTYLLALSLSEKSLFKSASICPVQLLRVGRTPKEIACHGLGMMLIRVLARKQGLLREGSQRSGVRRKRKV